MTCYSCSERVHSRNISDAGLRCNLETKSCECTPPSIVDPLDERSRPDDAEWRGNSWCDEIMRAYKHQAIRTPLENAWVARCSRLRAFGLGFMNWMNIQTVPPDVFYNPQLVMWVGLDLIEGVFTYWNEGWNKEGQAPQGFCDRLIEKRVDPIIVFKLLDFG